MRCKLRNSVGGKMGESAATLGREGSGPSRADRRQWEVKQMKKRKIVGQVSSHTRNLKRGERKNKMRKEGEKYEELKKEILEEARARERDAKGNSKDSQIKKQKIKENNEKSPESFNYFRMGIAKH
jgi:hypothetical protein